MYADYEDYIVCSTSQQIGSQIISYDVSEIDTIAVAFTNKHISIIDSSGAFLNDYEVMTSGSFVIEWQEEYLCIHLFRENMILKVNQDGEVTDMIPTDNTIPYDNKLQELRNVTSISRNGKEYQLVPSDSIFSAADTLVYTDSAGNEKIVISTDREYHNYLNMHIGMVTALILTFFLIVIISRMDHRKEK